MVWVLVVIVLLIIWLAVLKKRIFTKVYHYLNVEDYDNLFKCVDSRLARMMIPIYMREYYKLNAYIKMDDYQNVTKQFNYLMKLNPNSYQLNSILISGFNYYCYQNDKKKCRKILDKMKEVFDEQRYFKYQRHFDILMNNVTNYIDEIESEIKKHRGKKRGYLEYLLAKSYQSKNNKSKYNEYLNQSMKDYQISKEQFEKNITVM